MKTIVGVRFRTGGKVYFFDPGEHPVKRGSHVIVETARGVEYGTCVDAPRQMEDEKVTAPLKPLIRMATAQDDAQDAENREKEKAAVTIAKEKIRARALDMKLIDVEYTFDRNKIVFYFTADGRVDFRELVKDLASVFRTRIELRQIGVRDATKMLGGLGSCGRVLCCHSYMSDFIPVSIKMAKEQSLSLNPGKISGMCGRLMCCLQYEADTYAYLNRKLPRVGDEVTTPDGTVGTVRGVDVLRQRVQVLVDVNDEKEMEEYPVEELKFTKRPHGGKKEKGNQENNRNGKNREKLSKDELKELARLEKPED
ncbi:MAG: stage 0 sporulation family protein [Lachnospiraceae bacterium]|nr:stage 0 sporulation family protein [Lachnospiraceae bacterium]